MAATQTVAPLAMPTAQMPLTDAGGVPSQPWWRFFYGLYTRSAATIPYLVATTITAAGTTQADATQLDSEWNEVSTTPLNSGVVLNPLGAGFNSIVFNQGANPLKIYPPLGCAIDALGANNPYTLAAAGTRDFYQLSATEFRSR